MALYKYYYYYNSKADAYSYYERACLSVCPAIVAIAYDQPILAHGQRGSSCGRAILYTSLFTQKEQQGRKQTMKATTNKH